jgi:tyrosine-protein kinase Etk/Wzc
MTVEEQVQSTAKSELASLSLKDLFYKYLRFLPLFVVCVALSLFTSYIYLRYATLVYQSVGTLSIKDEKSAGGSGSNDKLEQILVSDGKRNIQNEIEYLRSRPLMERVVRSLNLNFTYLAKGNIKELNIYKANPFTIEAFQIADSTASFSFAISFDDGDSFRINNEGQRFRFNQLFRNNWGVFRLVRNPRQTLSKDYIVSWQPTKAVADGLLADLVVAPKLQGTGILTLVKEATNPDLAADVVNQLMAEYQEAIIEDKNIATEKTIAFIDSRLNVVQEQLDSINQRLLRFQQVNNIIDPEAQSANYLSRIEESSKEASSQLIQLNNAEMIDGYMRQQRFEPVPSSLGVADETLTALLGSYNTAQLERKRLLENAPPGNVAVQQKEQEIETLRERVLESLRPIRSAYRSSIGTIQGRGGAAQGQIKTMPAKIQMLADIRRDQQTKQVIYNSLTQKREESAIALASQISNTKVLQEATPNMAPIKPNRRNVQLLAIVVGLLLPALFIFVMELLNDKVTTRNDIERITRAPILGEVGHNFGKENLVVTSNNRKVVAEQFRILRSNLQYVLNNIEKPVVLVTSSFSGEGKSFISTNMGAVMALTGKRTIVLEFDIRKPKVLSHLNLPKRPGLTNFLLGKTKLEELPIPVPGNENLFVLACGPVPPNPAELLLDPKLDELFSWLRANFDVVIMDTAPVGMVSDALTLSKYVNATLYIVRQGHTFKKQVGMIDELYQSKKLPKVSLVMNDVKIRSGYGYYGYGRYGYGYGYGSGYFEEEEGAQDGLLNRWFGWLDTRKWGKKKKRKRTTV